MVDIEKALDILRDEIPPVYEMYVRAVVKKEAVPSAQELRVFELVLRSARHIQKERHFQELAKVED